MIKGISKKKYWAVIVIALFLAITVNFSGSQVKAEEISNISDEAGDFSNSGEIGPMLLPEAGKWEASGKLRFGITNPGVPNVRFGRTIDHIYGIVGTGNLTTTPGFQFIDPKNPDDPVSIFFENGEKGTVDGFPAIIAKAKSTATVGSSEINAKIEMVSIKPGVVQHRYTLTNASKGIFNQADFYPYKVVDTKLADNDQVPIKSLGEGRGVSIESEGYFLSYLMKGDGRATSYKGISYDLSPKIVFLNLASPDKSQLLAPEGLTLFKNGDTAIYQIWPREKLGIGESVTVIYDVTIEMIDQLKIEKTGQNLTNSEMNTVGDNYEYAVELTTKKDPFTKIKLEDTLPKGLAKPSKIGLKDDATGEIKDYDVSKVYSDLTRKITISNIDIPKNSGKTLIYETVIEADAKGQTLTNKASASGKDKEGTAYTETTEYDIYVEEAVLGRVLVNYVDLEGTELADQDILAGEVETPYPKIEPKEIPGYVLVETEGPVEGDYQIEDQQVTFTYLEVSKGFELKHEGTNSNGKKLSEGIKVKQGEELTYTLSLNSLDSINEVQGNYAKVNFALEIAEELENISNIQVLDNEGKVIGQGAYDEASKMITGDLTAKDVAIQKTVNLTYQTTVKKETEVGAIIKSSGRVNSEVTLGEESLVIKELTSNELANEIEAGMLEFISAPTTLDFGKDLLISHKAETYGVNELEGEALIVQDNRSPGNSWEVTAAIITELTSSLGVLDESLYYANGQTDLKLTKDEQVVEARTTEDGNAVNLSEGWNETKGIRLKVKAGQAKAASYTGEIRWTLRNVPNK